MHSPRLRVTERCLRDDLSLDPSLVTRDARSYCAESEVLRAFVVRREAAPSAGEPIKGIDPYGLYLSLHVGRGRAVTYWDNEQDVCWLLAYSATHATHEERDAYQYFMYLGSRDELLPTADDYESLDEVTSESIIDGLAIVGSELYRQAREAPGTEVNKSYQGGHALIVIDLMIIEGDEYEEGWLSITFPKETALSEYTALDLISRLLPSDIVAGTLHLATTFGGRVPRHDELVFTWAYPGM